MPDDPASSASARQLAEDHYYAALDLVLEGHHEQASKSTGRRGGRSQFTDALHGLSRALQDLNRFDEAIVVAQQISEIDPDDILAHTSLSILYQKKGMVPEAEAEGNKARVLGWKQQLKKGPDVAGRPMREVVIVSSVRTPVGRAYKGTLRATRPDELAAVAIKGALDRVPQLDPKEIEDVILGCAMPEGEQGMNVARIASLRAGLPVEVSAVTINRFCSSGLQAIAMAAERIMSGRRRGHGRGRDGIDVDDSDGREQDFAESVAGGSLSGRVSFDGPDGGAGGGALWHYARAVRPVFVAQPSEGAGGDCGGQV
jgi:hypothetical protein